MTTTIHYPTPLVILMSVLISLVTYSQVIAHESGSTLETSMTHELRSAQVARSTNNEYNSALNGGSLNNVRRSVIFARSSTSETENHQITGTVIDAVDLEPIPFAHISVFDTTRTYLISGTAADVNGNFSLKNTYGLSQFVIISALGYDPYVIRIDPATSYKLGNILLQPTVLEHDEIFVTAQQVHSRTQSDRTTYYVHELLRETAPTGADILRIIPDVQVDFMQNITMQGSKNVLILVNGQERSSDMLKQLHSSDISHVEIMHTPPARYASQATGVINVVLHPRRDRHLLGHLHLEAPGSTRDVYIFPAYSLQYGTGKVNLFTSYNGDVRYFDLTESARRTVTTDQGPFQWTTTQHVRQNNWSHKFNYGADIYPSKQHTVSVFGWLNPFSGTFNGNTTATRPPWDETHTSTTKNQFVSPTSPLPQLNVSDDLDPTHPISYQRHEHDQNMATYQSLLYRFNPKNEHNGELTLDVNRFTLNSDQTIRFEETGTGSYHHTRPTQHTWRIRSEYGMSILNNGHILVGSEWRHEVMKNPVADDFRTRESHSAAYGTLRQRMESIEVQIGIRYERINSDSPQRNDLSGLYPVVNLMYRHPQTGQSIRGSYRQSVQYPHVYQVNTGRAIEDPFAYWTGNDTLTPSHQTDIRLEYSVPMNNSHLSATVYWTQVNDAIQGITTLTRESLFESKAHNVGNIRQAGLHLSANVMIGSQAGLQPYFRYAATQSNVNELFASLGLENHRKFSWAGGMSVYAGLGGGFMIAGIVDYSSPQPQVQRTEFSDVLYFVSLSKNWGQHLRAELASGLPLLRNFTYRGYEIRQHDLNIRSTGNINLSALPLMIKFTYRFNRGEQRDRIVHSDATTPSPPGRGF